MISPALRARVAGGAHWSPNKIPGLLFRAAPVAQPSTLTLASTTHVSTWADAAGGAGVLSQSTDAQRPTVDSSVTFGGGSTVKFDRAGAQKIGTTSGGASGNPSTHSGVFVGVVARFDEFDSFRLCAALGQPGTAHATFGVSVANTPSNVYWAGGHSHINVLSGVDSIPAAGYTALAGSDDMVATDTTTFHIVVGTNDGTTSRLYVDGYLAVAPPTHGATTAPPVADGGYNLAAGYGFIPHVATFEVSAHVADGIFGSGALSVADRRRYERYVLALSQRNGGTAVGSAASRRPQLICGIDSVTFGSSTINTNVHGTGDWPTQIAPLLDATCTIWNLGIPGRTLVTALTQAEQDLAGHSTGLAPINIFVVWALANDMILHYATPGYDATAYANLLTYLASIATYSPGSPVIVCTLHHCSSTYDQVSDHPAFNTACDALNTRTLNGAAANGYVVADVGALASCDLSVNPSHSADGYHPDMTRYGDVATLIAPLVNVYL